jgi:biopolymer transport protein ExbB/TolQ
MNNLFESISASPAAWAAGLCVLLVLCMAAGIAVFAIQLRRMSRSIQDLAHTLDGQSRSIQSLGRMLQEDIAAVNANLVRQQNDPSFGESYASHAESLRTELRTLRGEIDAKPGNTTG